MTGVIVYTIMSVKIPEEKTENPIKKMQTLGNVLGVDKVLSTKYNLVVKFRAASRDDIQKTVKKLRTIGNTNITDTMICREGFGPNPKNGKTEDYKLPQSF